MTDFKPLRAIALAVLVAACSAPAVAMPSMSHAPDAASSDSHPSASPIASPSGAPATLEFDAAFGAAVDAAREIPLAGLSPTEPATPVCQGIGQPGQPASFCLASMPIAEPLVTLTAVSVGSRGSTGMMMAYAAMPDGIEGTPLPAPEIGEDARLSRTWSERGCAAVLAVGDGTLIISVQVRLEAGPATADCGLEAPTDYLEKVGHILLDGLAPFRAVGLPVDDLAARDVVVDLITDGNLEPDDREIVTLPPEFAHLSDSGDVIAIRDADDWTIVFFEVRGMVDNYSGWVFRSSGNLGAEEDPLQGGRATVERLDDHWFHVTT
jgi:hypothetical protein